MRTDKQQPKRPAVRSLKIQQIISFNARYARKEVPEIKLRGDWLRQLEFEAGERVVVTMMNGLLIITPMEQ